ncbi:MAG TPA: T9SS type A sorting domain-containing protein, partial [Chitinophagales bacterium]|nr:T9SS type A sorting domain-containing protein [Chitinophagales bacterium]
NTNVIIGGSSDDAAADNVGPDVDVFMNDESFVFGGLTDENPVLLIKLIDSSGINALGNAIGHDITATLDDDQQTMLKLNEYYEADLDKYQSGSVLYPLNDIAEGRHTVTVKAWDVYNNSGDGYTEFVVAETADLALDHVLNYPNPFTDNTSFWFEHNRPGDVLDVKIEIFTVSGKRVKTIQQQVITDGYRVDDITWDGLDDYGDVIGKGVYVYKLSVKAASDNSKASEFQKLVILK